MKRCSKRGGSLLLSFIVAGCSSGTPTEEKASSESLQVTQYQYFLVYPHIEKGMAALRESDERTAISRFKHAHELAPESTPITLFLVNAYREFDHHEKANSLLEEQLRRHPDDQQLRESLAAGASAAPAHLAAAASTGPKQADSEESCRGVETPECVRTQFYIALGNDDLPSAWQVLSALPGGADNETELLDEFVQRSIYLEEWGYAVRAFDRLHRQTGLSAVQKEQFFNSLLMHGEYDQLLEIQAQGWLDEPARRLALASALATRNASKKLQKYLQHRPRFDSAEHEIRWLHLLYEHASKPGQAIVRYGPAFESSRRLISDVLIPRALFDDDLASARQLLTLFPSGDLVALHFELSIAESDSDSAEAYGLELVRRSPADLRVLDRVTYQLSRIGQTEAAANLLLQAYPFHSDAGEAQERVLMERMAALLYEQPAILSTADWTRLSQPLPRPWQRELQAAVLDAGGNCEGVRELLSDLSDAYRAPSWRRLAACYEAQSPQLALYAARRAVEREPSHAGRRALAFYAYAAEEFAIALHAWDSMPPESLTGQDVLAAANTAFAAENIEALREWLAEAESRQLTDNASYWWLRAQLHSPAQHKVLIEDLSRALAIAPEAHVYAARGRVFRSTGELDKAVTDMMRAVELDPDSGLYRAELGYALAQNGRSEKALEEFEIAAALMPDEASLIKQLAFSNANLGKTEAALNYAKKSVDLTDHARTESGISDEQIEQHFRFRRLHEDLGRRWTFNASSWLGSNAVTATVDDSSWATTESDSPLRSYTQLDAEYRLGSGKIVQRDRLSAYGRVFAGSENATSYSLDFPTLGLGVKWKPLEDQVFWLSAEQQLPLSGEGESDLMLRASASFLDTNASGDWQPLGSGWLSQNLYVDFAHYVKQGRQAYTIDYSAGWHYKLADGATLEPYGRIQHVGIDDRGYFGSDSAGVGVRWNRWTGGDYYDAWPQKWTVGLEYRRTLRSDGGAGYSEDQPANSLIFTLGGRW
ncbi:tetratricopeptide repeat protein [Proteobacteria bacterium 005FR1]|nr:tetratricopeptide repeat protein [Proteobacteria bacterium 005FR1]